MKTAAAIILGKVIFFLSRLLNLGGGFAAPGLYALKIDPDLIQNLSSQIDKQIIITGTNGKTTTSAMLSHLLKTGGAKVIRNRTGSNLERGIASILINHASFFGEIAEKVAVWEVDEAAFNSLALKLKPNLIVFLNVYRDQLDRYGEVDSIVNKWVQTLKKLPSDTKLLINKDDGSLERLFNAGKKYETYSVEGLELRGEKDSTSAKEADFKGTKLNSSLSGSNFTFEYSQEKIPVPISIPGKYNVYNAVAALSAKFLISDLSDTEVQSLKDLSSSFGRSERFNLKGQEGFIFLIKNPVGASQVLETVIPDLSEKETLIMVLNDNFADGKDVSWIWDIDLEKFKMQNAKFKIIVTGTRIYDLALRLKYAGVKEENIKIEQSLDEALKNAPKTGRIFILPTYTAMLELQKILVRKGIKKHYWREN